MILMLSVRLAGTIHSHLDAYAPSNMLIRWFRSPGPGQRLALPVSAALAVAYGLLGAWLTSIIESGGAGWFNLFVLVCAWNTIKFSLVAMAAAVRLAGRLICAPLRSRQTSKMRAA